MAAIDEASAQAEAQEVRDLPFEKRRSLGDRAAKFVASSIRQ
jgi:hypothetical protein